MTREGKSETLEVRREIMEELLRASASLKISLETIATLARQPVLSRREEFALHCLRHLHDDEDILERDAGAREYQRELLRKLVQGEKI